nr:MAG TPA: hypothetical protein [Caudoviricetes sp.]
MIMNERLPLGVLKQAFMKIQSFMEDIHEAADDSNLTEDEQYEFHQMGEVSSIIAIRILNIVQKDISEDDFLNMDIPMDEIEEYPYKPMEEY